MSESHLNIVPGFCLQPYGEGTPGTGVEQISHLVVVFLLLTLGKQKPTG